MVNAPVSESSTLPPWNEGDQESPNSESSLFPSAFDGSHLPWQDFRSNVLLPHGIHIVTQPAKNRLPSELWEFVERRSQNSARFEDQKKKFRIQVSTGQGFGPSPLVPPNLLPPTPKSSCLARCMIPRFCRDALPERAPEREGSLYELSLPHPVLGCGFTQQAFDSQEVALLPQHLAVEGTKVNFETGYVSSHADVHCPFLTFERASGFKQEELETANNRCAIAGAWCMRALHMVFNKAYQSTIIPVLPTAFSCVIDNNFAVLNYHWIDHAQEFHMAPLCKFDLTNDSHFTKFLVWIEGIEDWGLQCQLPRIKSALSRLAQPSPTPTLTAIPSLTLSPASNHSSENSIVQALRTSFEAIPWRIDETDFTPVSSITAGWDSPRERSDAFTPMSRSSTHSWGSPYIDRNEYPYPTGPNPPMRNIKQERKAFKASCGNKQLTPKLITTPPPINSSLVLQKRLNDAHDEIRDLKSQLQEQRKGCQEEHEVSISFLREELSAVKELLVALLKESTRGRWKSLSLPPSPQPPLWSPPPIQSSSKLVASSKSPEPGSSSRSRPQKPLEVVVGSTNAEGFNEVDGADTPKAKTNDKNSSIIFRQDQR